MSATSIEPVAPAAAFDITDALELVPILSAVVAPNSRASKWLARATAAASFYKLAVGVAANIRESRRKTASPASLTTLNISFDSPLYNWLTEWLPTQDLSFDKSEYEVSISPVAIRRDEPCVVGYDESPPTDRDLFRLLPAGDYEFTWNGIRVDVVSSVMQPPKDTEKEKLSSLMAPRFFGKLTMHVFTEDQEQVRAMLWEARNFAAGRPQERQSKVYAWRYGWDYLKPCPRECNVILPGGTYTDLKADLERFLHSRNWYEGVGVPYRRGYLLHGVPGSGKTTTVQTLAGALKLDIYILNLSKTTDDSLQSAVSSMASDSVLLLEDIDCAFEERESDEAGCTLSGLLNVLDGVASGDGQIVFMTTNKRPEELDAALVRPGRADKKIEFLNARQEQIEQLAGRFKIDHAPFAHLWAGEGIPMAEVQGRLIDMIREREEI